MKTVVKISNLNSQNDVRIIQETLSNEEGILACEIKKAAKSIVIVHDSAYIKEEEIADIIESIGYIII